jgi:hypothetical protein
MVGKLFSSRSAAARVSLKQRSRWKRKFFGKRFLRGVRKKVLVTELNVRMSEKFLCWAHDEEKKKS